MVSRRPQRKSSDSSGSDSELSTTSSATSEEIQVSNEINRDTNEQEDELVMESAEFSGSSPSQMEAMQRMEDQLKDSIVLPEPTLLKPTLFRGYENENVDRWLQRFALYLANRRIQDTSPQAAIQLALHLSGPAESFYYNLPSTVQSSYAALRDSLKERFAPAHRSLRLRQALSARRQGADEPIEKFLADLNEKFSCLDLRDEDKLSYLIQGLRADIQCEVLKKDHRLIPPPKTLLG